MKTVQPSPPIILGSPPTLDGVLRDLLEQIVDIVEVDFAVIQLQGSAGRTLSAGGSDGLEEAIAPAAAEIEPALRADGANAVFAVPLVIGERMVGLLAVGTVQERAFSEDDARLLQVLADHVALAVEGGGVMEQHQRAWSLQRTLLAEPLPDIPGVTLAARYVPARVAAGIGGGWYDVIPLPEGRVALVVGDVASRGERAATLTAELRNALRAYAVDGDDPSVVVRKLWHFVHALAQGEMATFLYACFEPDRGVVRYASAGHPTPVFVGPGREVSFGTVVPAAPLGVGGPPRDVEVEVEVEPGATMLLYTEGLTERRGERLAARRGRVADAARGATDPAMLCSHLLARLVNGDRPEDDIALLAVQVADAPDDELHCTIAAVPQELAPLRRRLARWLAARGAGEHESASIVLAVQEACANAVEHAYGLADDTFDFGATHDGGVVELTIRDRGNWRPPRGEHRGRGLSLMHALVDEVEVLAEDGGTTVRLTRRLDGRTPR